MATRTNSFRKEIRAARAFISDPSGVNSASRTTTSGQRPPSPVHAAVSRHPRTASWHHYAQVVDESNAEFFIDGVSRATSSGFSIGGASPTLLGPQFGGNSERIAGQMRDVRIYRTTLSA